MQTIALVDYGSGNLRSAERALLAAAHQANQRREVRVTRDPDFVRRADRVVLPGQGAFDASMTGLKAVDGLLDAMTEAVKVRGAPFLGICVGLQLLMREGLEHGRHAGLGWIDGVCRPLDAKGLTLPHMGWNTLLIRGDDHPVLAPLAPARHVYFAHSYIVEPANAGLTVGETTHGETFAAALARDNLVGVQFHPEKSQAAGLAMLARFVDWTP